LFILDELQEGAEIWMSDVVERAEFSLEVIETVGLHVNQGFQRHRHISFSVKSFIHDTHATAAELFLDDKSALSK